MVYRLRSKFIKITMLSALSVFLVLFLILFLSTNARTNRTLDILTDLISQNGGFFPRPDDKNANFDALPFAPDHMNPESSYSTRFFSVQFDRADGFLFADTTSIQSIAQAEAVEYAQRALSKGRERGWIGDYRYKVYETSLGSRVLFVNGIDTKAMNRTFLITAAASFAGSLLVVLILVVLLSKRAVKPIAESYEKQKQFITDANHELKTPLAIIRTDLELAVSELGENEWLSDIRDASKGMSVLVGKLVTLARMDEERTQLEKLPFDLSEAVTDTAEAFVPLTQARCLSFHRAIPLSIPYTGNEESIRQLVSILMDNAVKYCDPGGCITLTLTEGRHPVLTVDNSFQAVQETELNRLFDRFYRSDKARTTGSGSGIGLSIARAIVEQHHGQIEARNLAGQGIRFWVRL